jgi:uncharacterized protein YcbX
VAGDRVYALVDENNKIGTAKIQRKWGNVFRSRARYLSEPNGEGPTPAEITLPDGERVMTTDAAIDARMAALVGFEARLISEKPENLRLESYTLGTVPDSYDEAPPLDFPVVNGFFDLGPLHVLTTATLDTLRSLRPESRFEARRFRPNIVIQTPAELTGFAENAWSGKTLAIGDEVRIKVMMPTIRCNVTTVAQDDLPTDRGVLETAAQHNSANVGIYALVERGGMVRKGAEVWVE